MAARIEIIFGVFALTVVFCYVQGYNYCEGDAKTELCGDGVTHFMCDPTQIGSNGKFIDNPPMTRLLRNEFIKCHNSNRNSFASGTLGFPAAARMREVIWDDELAYIAIIHTRQCTMTHDKCHNTKRYKYSGQNLAQISASRKKSITSVINENCNSWFDEYKTITDKDNFSKNLTPEVTSESGHFTVMVNEKVSRIGCAIAYCEGGELKHSYFVCCNYDYTNMLYQKVYETDETGIRCDDLGTELTLRFQYLCKNNGQMYELD